MDYIDSYYSATINRGSNYPSLKGNLKSQVCVIGGGFTGLNTAINLAKKGLDVVLIESNRIGWGASGRNGGQLISGFCLSDYFSKHGTDEEAQAIWELGARSADLVRERITEFNIQCDLKEGFIDVALNRLQMLELLERKADWELRGYQHDLILVEGQDVKKYVNSERYIGGLIDSGSGHLHPLNLCLGEAQAANKLGVKIFEATKANKIEPGKSIRINTDDGCIQAETLVLAGNAYIGGLNKKLRRMIMPASSCIIATEPMSAERSNDVIPSDMAVCDLNTILDYYRLSPDKRMLFGGRFNYSGIEPSPDKIRTEIRKRMIKVFPALDDLAIDYAWSGNVAVTINRIPQLGRLSENIYYSQGYSGHGVAPTHMAAKIISSGILKEWNMIDTLSKVKHIQLPGGKWFSSPAMSIGMAYYRLKDFLASKS